MSVLEDLKAAAENHDSGSIKELCSGELTSQITRSYSLLSNHRITSSDGKTFLVKAGRNGVDAKVVGAALEREMLTRQMLENIAPDCFPKVISLNKAKTLLIQEDYPDKEVLQRRIFTDNKVDHGLTCQVARQVAKIHKLTHRKTLSKEQFDDICTRFGQNEATTFLNHNMFTESFDHRNISDDLAPGLRQSAERYLQTPGFTNSLAAIKQMFNENKECLILGDLNTSSILTKDTEGKIMFDNVCCAMIGPSSFDLAGLMACYVTAHYSHMLTEHNHNFNLTISHEMHAAIQKTFETYFDEGTPNTRVEDNQRTQFVSAAAGFAGLELIRRAITLDPSHAAITNNTREAIFQSGQRLLNAQHRIDNVGRLLMIGLQLC